MEAVGHPSLKIMIHPLMLNRPGFQQDQCRRQDGVPSIEQTGSSWSSSEECGVTGFQEEQRRSLDVPSIGQLGSIYPSIAYTWTEQEKNWIQNINITD